MTTNLALIGVHDANTYVGTRVEARVQFLDAWTDEPLIALTPTLTFIDPDGTENVVGTMDLIDDNGTYSRSFVPDSEGDWTVVVTIGTPFETYRKFDLYVSPR